MNWSKGVRQVHRWMSALFMLAFFLVLSFVVRGREPAQWIYLLPLLPLGFLMATGVYLFLLPHVQRWRGERRAA